MRGENKLHLPLVTYFYAFTGQLSERLNVGRGHISQGIVEDITLLVIWSRVAVKIDFLAGLTGTIFEPSQTIIRSKSTIPPNLSENQNLESKPDIYISCGRIRCR